MADVTKEDSAESAVTQAVERFGGVDILVNAVGGGAGKALHPAEDYPREAWDWIMELNLRSTIVATQPVVRHMIERGRGGAILNISSVRANLGINAGYSAYVAAKGAISALTRQWATEWAATASASTPSCPPSSTRPRWPRSSQIRRSRRASSAASPSAASARRATSPARRSSSCSDAASFVTGQVLGIDGGLTATQ